MMHYNMEFTSGDVLVSSQSLILIW